MSSNDEKYQKKYLKYKKKYIALELELQQNGGGSIFSTIKKGVTSAANTAASAAKTGATYAASAAKTGANYAANAASNPAVQAATLSAVSLASQNPAVQAKLSQVQRTYDNSPNLQLAAQFAQSNPTVQAAMANSTAQQAMNIAKAATSGKQTPDSSLNNLTLDQKQKLIDMLQLIK
jgi:hypothetical protein